MDRARVLPRLARLTVELRFARRYARAQLRDGSSLEALCDRLDMVLRHVDGCIKRHGEALVMGELDDTTPPCSGTCNFHTTTSTGTAKRRG